MRAKKNQDPGDALQKEVNRLGVRARNASNAEDRADQALLVYSCLEDYCSRLKIAWGPDDTLEELSLAFAQREIREVLRELMLKIAKRELAKMKRSIPVPKRKKRKAKEAGN